MDATLATVSLGDMSADQNAMLPVPWRDPHTVPHNELQRYIQALEAASVEQPRSAVVRTSLGVAYAVGLDVYKAMDALESATQLDPTYFWAQAKLAELHYRLRALPAAEREAEKAVNIAGNYVQLVLARRLLQTIRVANRSSTRNIEWTKSLTVPTVLLSTLVLLVLCGGLLWP